MLIEELLLREPLLIRDSDITWLNTL